MIRYNKKRHGFLTFMLTHDELEVIGLTFKNKETGEIVEIVDVKSKTPFKWIIYVKPRHSKSLTTEYESHEFLSKFHYYEEENPIHKLKQEEIDLTDKFKEMTEENLQQKIIDGLLDKKDSSPRRNTSVLVNLENGSIYIPIGENGPIFMFRCYAGNKYNRVIHYEDSLYAKKLIKEEDLPNLYFVHHENKNIYQIEKLTNLEPKEGWKTQVVFHDVKNTQRSFTRDWEQFVKKFNLITKEEIKEKELTETVGVKIEEMLERELNKICTDSSNPMPDEKTLKSIINETKGKVISAIVTELYKK